MAKPEEKPAMTTKHYEIEFSVTGSMRVSINLDPEKSTGVGLASADQIEEALKSGQLSIISSDETGEVIITSDGTIVGHTLHVRDETEWSDFTVTRIRTKDEKEKAMELEPNALRCPKCGKKPVTLRYHQSLRCLRSIDECNLEQQKVTLSDDDDSTEVLSEDHHTFICDKGHEWIADDNCIEW